MENHILNPLDDSRSNTAKIPQTEVPKDVIENRSTENYKTSPDNFTHFPSRVHSDKFAVGSNSDNEMKNIIHPEKTKNWATAQASTDISFDSNLVPSSPFSKALALAAESPISDINEDYFDSISQSPKSYTRKIRTEASSLDNASIHKESKLPEKSVQNSGIEQSLNSKDGSRAKDDVEKHASTNGIDSKVDNNLAGIAIS
jgi:hypothetical protein